MSHNTQHPKFAFEKFPPTTRVHCATTNKPDGYFSLTGLSFRMSSSGVIVKRGSRAACVSGCCCYSLGKETFDDSINFIDFPQSSLVVWVKMWNDNSQKMFLFRPNCFSSRFLIVVLIFCISSLYFAYNFHWCLLLNIQKSWLKVSVSLIWIVGCSTWLSLLHETVESQCSCSSVFFHRRSTGSGKCYGNHVNKGYPVSVEWEQWISTIKVSVFTEAGGPTC